jgi:hypothetical protein
MGLHWWESDSEAPVVRARFREELSTQADQTAEKRGLLIKAKLDAAGVGELAKAAVGAAFVEDAYKQSLCAEIDAYVAAGDRT